MKKTLTNGEIYTISHILFGDDEHKGLIRKKNLKTRMAVRQALKFNCKTIENANKMIVEMINEIISELFDEFKAQDKAVEDNEGLRIKYEFISEFKTIQQEKLNELSAQKIELDFYMIPESEFILYGTQNDGELTDAELDVLELFVEK
jgi:hypothetical protein